MYLDFLGNEPLHRDLSFFNRELQRIADLDASVHKRLIRHGNQRKEGLVFHLILHDIMLSFNIFS